MLSITAAQFKRQSARSSAAVSIANADAKSIRARSCICASAQGLHGNLDRSLCCITPRAAVIIKLVRGPVAAG